MLLHGKLTPHDYEDEVAADPRIDALRAKMIVREDKSFTRDFFDPGKRTNPHAMRIEFRNGTSTPEVRIDYPIGHAKRRREGLPIVEEKFRRSVEEIFPPKRRRRIFDICGSLRTLKSTPIDEFMDLFVIT